MDLQVRSSIYGNTDVHLDGSGIEHSKAVTDHSSQSTSYWQRYKEKYHRLGITEKQAASGTSKMIHGGGIPVETGLDNSVGSSCQTGKSRQQGSGAVGMGPRCHRTYSERCTRVSTVQQLMRPNSHPSNNIVDSADVKLDMLSSVTPLTGHTLTAADFRNRRNSQEITGSVLGGDDGEKTPMTATPRTSSLLNDPTLRKHLARAMGVDPSSDALEGEINRRVGSVQVPASYIKRTSSCRSATRGTNNNNKDDDARKPDLESLIKMHGKSQEDVTETKGKTEQSVTIGREKTARSDSGYGAEMPDMSRCLSEGSRIVLSGKRTKRTGTSQVERLRVKDVVHQSPEVTSCSTVGASEKHTTSPSMEEVKTNTSHLWNSTAKDTELYIVEDMKVLDTQVNRTESTDQKRSTPALPVSPAIARRPALPRRTYSMNVKPMPTDHEVRAGFHMPSFQEYKELKKQNSTTSDSVLTEEEEEAPSSGVSRTVPKSPSTECKTDCSDAALKVVQESVKQVMVSAEVKQTVAPVEATQKTEVVRKPRRKKTPKTPDEPTSAQNKKQPMLCKQKSTVLCDEPTMPNPEGKPDTKSVCVVSPVSVSNEHVDIVKPEKGIKKQQTIGDLGSVESDLPVAPPRRSRKLKVQLKLPSEVIPDGVGETDTECVDCIVARKTTKSNRRDETFRSSRCRLHGSKLSRQESDASDWTLTEEGEVSPLWHSLSVSTSSETLSPQQTAVVRSVSDVTDLNGEEKRRKPIRKRRTKPYKSDPFDNISKLDGDKTSEQVAAGQTQQETEPEPETRNVLLEDDILEFLRRRAAGAYDGIKENDDEVGELGQTAVHRRRHKVRRSLERNSSIKEEDGCGARVKRTDSGVCCEAYERLRESKETGPTCEDCGKLLEDSDIPEGLQWEEVFNCRKCKSRCVERKETIQEIVDTEISYGKDLRIIKGEFYEPMKTASLLNADQLQTIFSNLDELIEVNNRFADILQDALELANEQGDEDYTTVSIGQLFLDSSTMLLAYETYCVNQSGVAPYLEQLESNKELLRVFLSVSQTENSVLRRMSFKSFLMVPVQRIMRYPLLLERVYKATPAHHHDREYIKKAEEKIEAILNHINRKSKSPITSTLLRMSKRRFGGPPPGCRSIPSSSAENIEVNKVTVDILPWDRNEINFVLTGRMLYCQQQEQLWGKKGRTLKLLPIYCVLVTLGKGKRVTPVTPTEDAGVVPNRPTLQHAALVLVKEKWFKCTPLRDPIYLDKCVVSLDDEFRLIEVLDIASNESYAIKGENQEATVKWHEHLKQYSTTLGMWRSRRNALPNIMVKDLSKFHELAAADLYD